MRTLGRLLLALTAICLPSQALGQSAGFRVACFSAFARERVLEQTAPLLGESARSERTNEVQKFRIDVQRFIEDAQAELMRIQRDAESAFVIRLKPALAKVAGDKGLQLVLNADVVEQIASK